ncbi:MAG: hypothetical protein ACKVKL_16755 [Pseudomonadales bacterium]|jgi:hypothetical protein|tara:strand:+ start:3689 stop:3967 length:279 start_codon:yes stop_codon:yes gene_type:complete
MASNNDTNRPLKLSRPHQIENLTPDQLVAVVLRLAMEIGVLRDRLRTHEKLLVEQSLLSPEAVEDFRPSKQETAARQKANIDLIESIINDLS